MESLGENPRPAGCKKLKGYRDLWRIRVGDWRILYLIDDGAKLVGVTRIAHRREVYECRAFKPKAGSSGPPANLSNEVLEVVFFKIALELI